jgi:hypothetical protein
MAKHNFAVDLTQDMLASTPLMEHLIVTTMDQDWECRRLFQVPYETNLVDFGLIVD